MATTPHLSITLVEASQAQKEVTVNTALTRIDAVLNSGVVDKDLATPPVSPLAGDVYIVASPAIGAWIGKEKNLAYFDQIWRFITPRTGLQMWVADENINYVFNGTNWVAISINGETNTASNVGASGVGVFKQKSTFDLQFKKLVAGSNVTISGGTDDITISGSAAAGEANTASNAGTGTGLFKAKTGVDLAFKSLIAGSNVTITGGTNDVTVAGAAPGEVNTVSNIGTAGVGVFKQKTGVNFEFKKINAGSNKITITDDTANNEVDINVAEANLVLSSIGGTLANTQITAANITQHIASIKPTESMTLACSDETTALTVGLAKLTFRMPYAFTVTAVRASVTTAPTGSTIIVNIKEAGTTILGTKLSIDASTKTSVGAVSQATIVDSALADNAEMTIDIDQVGSTVAGAGLKVTLIGVRA